VTRTLPAMTTIQATQDALATEPTPVPYHRLAARPRQRWWIAVLATLGLVVLTVIVQIAIYVVAIIAAGLGDPDTDWAAPPEPTGYLGVGVGLASIAIALPLVLLGTRFLQSRPAGTVSSVVGRLRWGWLGLCLGLATVTIVVMLSGSIGLMALTGDPDASLTAGDLVGIGPFLGGMALLLALVPLQAAAEEYVFRGWLLQTIGAFMRSPWPAIAVQAVLFAAMHGWGTPWGFADLVAFGVILGWLTVRTGGLEAAIALHVMNNLISMSLGVVDGSLTLDETAADMPWQIMVVDVVTILGYAATVSWLARRRGLAVTRSPRADGGHHPVEQIGRGGVGEVTAAGPDRE
jgi:membrane protease YdiL (CAAX protease family)